MSLLQGYCEGRKELADEVLGFLETSPETLRLLADILWSSGWCDETGEPHAFFPSRWKHRIAVTGETPDVQKSVQKKGSFLRFQTTTNWGVHLAQWNSADDYFQSLSKNSRKKLNWISNKFVQEKVRYEPITGAHQIDRFLAIFRKRWPDSQWENEYYDDFIRIYEYLEKCGKNYSYLMVDSAGNDVAGFMGYFTANAYNLHLFCRTEGLMDKFSPGFYLVWHIIRDLYQKQACPYFFMGPGRFDYKEKYLAQEMPVYRYEKRCLTNLPSMIRLYNRARKQSSRRG